MGVYLLCNAFCKTDLGVNRWSFCKLYRKRNGAAILCIHDYSYSYSSKTNKGNFIKLQMMQLHLDINLLLVILCAYRLTRSTTMLHFHDLYYRLIPQTNARYFTKANFVRPWYKAMPTTLYITQKVAILCNTFLWFLLFLSEELLHRFNQTSFYVRHWHKQQPISFACISSYN